jgi:hypothetical protein
MSYQEPLSQTAVAVSISNSPEMPQLGLAPEHLNDAMTELARHLLAMGARLVYGGDLRKDGFTPLLYEIVARHRRDADVGDRRLGVVSYLPWPVHRGIPRQALHDFAKEVTGYVELHFLDKSGHDIPLDQLGPSPEPSTDDEWAEALTAMRAVTTKVVNARIVLGGGVTNFKGRMPGIAEEALTSLDAGQPVFLLGGFGGCAKDLASDLKLAPSGGGIANWPGRKEFAKFSTASLNNGLTPAENERLAQSVHVDEIVALTLRGLLRLSGDIDRTDS